MREKHELETKIINLQELANRSADEEQVAKLKKYFLTIGTNKNNYLIHKQN